MYRKIRTDKTIEMDITPLIDVVFLLLIFFMVCSTMGNKSPVQLPVAYFGSAVSEHFATVITMDGDGRDSVVYIGNGTSSAPLPADFVEEEDALYKAVEKNYRNGKTAVLLKAAKTLKRAEVARIESAISRVSGISLHIAVFEKKSGI